MASSSSSSSSGLGWKYDVFINFRGEDTRRGFVSHLYNALAKKPINAFIDAEKLRKGDHLSELLTAIRESRLSIVVFSQDYASSTWCLKELVQILECKDTNNQIVLPIFYEVDPSDIRRLKRKFAEAFAKHDCDSNAEMEEVQRWRSALKTATSLSGWDSRNYENDAVLIEEIVEDVYSRLINISSTSSKDNGLVDISGGSTVGSSGSHDPLETMETTLKLPYATSWSWGRRGRRHANCSTKALNENWAGNGLDFRCSV